ncbi:MAG: cupin domain-containing protein [Candidatus Krumholzibacteriota bacterium]|nr:cupin domain-containing protein [Candidatus Krumholzibacteriota bacterium]
MNGMERVVPKLWGEEHWIVNREYCGKKLLLKKGLRCSMHRHPIKDETFHLETGVVFLELGGEEFFLRAGDTMHIPAGTPHRFSGLEDSVILEFSTHHEDDDVIRESESGPIPADELAALQQRAG